MVEAKGFAPLIRQVHVEVAQHPSVDVALNLGAANETIEVRAAAPLLESESSTLSNDRSEKDVRDLPLKVRNFAELMGLTAGVINVHTQLTGTLPLAAERGESSYSVNGLRAEENHFLIDGISNNENHVGLSMVLLPPIDAVQEFRMETSAADARYGHGGGGTVNLVTKSGTSRYHGGVFEFFRNSSLDSRNFFDQSKPAFRLSQFGATFGGPMRPGKDPRSFFFADYEGARTNQALTYISTVPTGAMHRGDFSEAPQRIYDPASQALAPGLGFTRSPFPGNIVSSALIDLVGSRLLGLYPPPNLPGIANNYLYQPSRRLASDEGDVRLDHRFSQPDTGFLRFSQARADVFQPGPLPAPAAGGTIAGQISQPARQAVLSETHLFAPTTVNIARFGWSRVEILGTDITQDQPYGEQIGIPGSNIPGDPRTYGLPYVLVTGAATLGTIALPATVVTNNFQFDENLSLVRGRHMIQIGGDLIRRQYNVLQTAIPRGMMRFSTDYSSNPSASAGTGLGFADLLMGRPIQGSLLFVDGTRGLRRSDVSAYIQEDYKINKLTLNLGVRYENYFGYPWKETHDRQYNFAPPSGVVQVGANGTPPSGLAGRNANLMPRAGLAWRVHSKMVLRAAYGIFYSAPQIIQLSGLASNPPELIGASYTNDQFNFPGATPASAGAARAEELLGELRGDRLAGAAATRGLAGFRALQGRFDEARSLLIEARAVIEDLGLRWLLPGISFFLGPLEVLAGDYEAAERALRPGIEVLDAAGETGRQSSLVGLLADVLARQERFEEALVASDRAKALSPGIDAASQIFWRVARARSLVGLGRAAEAESLARAAVELGAASTFFHQHADAAVCLAEVLRALERPAEAAAVLAEAVVLYERKESIPGAARARVLLAEISP